MTKKLSVFNAYSYFYIIQVSKTRDVTAHRPDVCLLLTGTNDFIGGKSAEQAFDNIKRILAKAAQLDSMQMILLTPLLTYPPMAERMWVPADYTELNQTL